MSQNCRPNCSVEGCCNISDYVMIVRNGKKMVCLVSGLVPVSLYEEIELCAEHESLFKDILKRTDLSKIPDRTKEKVKFD